MNDTEAISIDRVLYDEQYRLKLGIFYLLSTKEVLGIVFFCILVFDSIYARIGIGGLAILFYYRLWFDKSRDGDQVDIFLFRTLTNLKKSIRRRVR